MEPEDFFVHSSSFIDDHVTIGKGTRIWHFCHILSGAVIGESCSLGQNVCVSGKVLIGDRVRIQNNVSIYDGVWIEDDVFLGPSCVFTNIANPRSQVVRNHLYEKTIVRKGASIGANATLVCGVTIGRYAFVAAGAVVTRDVPDYTLVQGVPGRAAGWISRHGHRLVHTDDSGVYTCPESGLTYKETKDGNLVCLDLDEDRPLPARLKEGQKEYRYYKNR